MSDFKLCESEHTNSDDSELTEMINSILDWWHDKGQYHYPEKFDSKPRFVELAQKWSD